MKVTAKRTPVSPSEMKKAMLQSSQAIGEPLTNEAVSVLLAQWALETGWGRSMYCYNIGNIKSDQKSGNWYFIRCREVIGGKTVWFDPDHPACCFRAYQTLLDGAVEYVRFLKKKYRAAWASAKNGDCRGFCHELKRLGYYTASENSYTAAVSSLFNTFRKLPTDP